MNEADTLTTSQKGKIAELFLATALMAASRGRLSPFVPLSDDHGIDLIVRDKVTGGAVAVQVKAWLGKAPRGTVQFDVRKAAHRSSADAVLVALVIDPNALSMSAAWMIRMSEVPGLAIDQPDKYALTPNPSPSSRDRYSAFRKADAAAIAAALIGMIEERAALQAPIEPTL